MRGLAFAGGAALAAAVAGTALLGPADVREGIRLTPDDPNVVALGARVYGAECASCHGADLEGQSDWRTPGADGLRPAPPHDETGHTWHHDDATLFRLTKLGLAGILGDGAPPSGMPAYEGVLTDAEILAALSYIKSTWPEDVRATHDDINARTAHQ